ncbi:MAG: Na+/H+ antiporter NhaC [Fidelibacterota bacterium]
MQQKKQPKLVYSIIPLIAMGLFLGVGYGVFQLKAEILLICSALIAGIIALLHGYSWKELETGIVESVSRAMPAMLIVICVGLLVGSWIASGTIPMLIYYGLQMISPSYFLLTACIVSSFVSLFTGTSWGTVGTIGIAFMGIAEGLGIPNGPAAGAIITGAYFGDKLSPFSDTTNLAPVAARSNLFDHIRHMLWTTLPAWILGLIIYFFIGLKYGESQAFSSDINLLLNGLTNNFNFNILLLLPPAVILFFAIKKLPTIPGMILATLLAGILGMIFQGISINNATSAMATGYVSNTGVEQLDKLLTRGGMMSMMYVTLIAFCAFAFAGIMQATGMLKKIMDQMLKFIHSTGSLIISTSVSCITMAFITGSSFLAILVPGELFANAYRERGLAAKNLSRTTEDSGTVVVPLVPWSMAGVYMAGTLGVPTLEYAQWTFMFYFGIIFAWIYGFTGIGIAQKINDDETVAGS